jgi:hypothetical protein
LAQKNYFSEYQEPKISAIRRLAMSKETVALDLPGDVSESVQKVAKTISAYSTRMLQDSAFFSALQSGTLQKDQLIYIFSQYKLWRDQFHTWFGLCILKSGSCSDPGVAEAIRSLAEHTVAEIRDDHTGMYNSFLKAMGVDAAEIREPSQATRRYSKSYIEIFGTGEENFAPALFALSARELFASLRNTFVIKVLGERYNIDASHWWKAHEELELKHFTDTLMPLSDELKRLAMDRIIETMKHEIDRHVFYWDKLYGESSIKQAVAA